MKNVIEILRELQNNSGNKLVEILSENYDNEELKDILYFVYNPYIVTGLSKKKMSKAVQTQYKYTPAQNIYNVFDHLIEHGTGTDIDIAYVLEFISKREPEYRNIYRDIFTKELRLGITAKTINKVWKDFIPEFNVMLAEKYWDRMEGLEKTKPNIIITQKLDGIRAVAKVFEGKVNIFSRQGKEILGLIDIEMELGKLPNGCYDGELLSDKQNIPSKDLYRETVTIVNSKDTEKKGIIFNIFDYIPIVDFKSGYCDMPCLDRKDFVYEQLRKIEPNWLTPVEILYQGEYNENIVRQELNKQIVLEHEGVMVNIANAPYQAKRTIDILKVKAMQDCDLRIIGFEEGTGKNKGTLGAIVVDYKGFEVRVGSGFTDKDRIYFWTNQDNLLGRIITVQYFEETTNKKDNSLSLRFPVYKELREEGKEVSYY